MTSRRVTNAAGTAMTIGHHSLAASPTPMQTISQLRYIGFRVKRNGPSTTSTVPGRVGSGVVPTRNIDLAVQVIIHAAADIRTHPANNVRRRLIPRILTGTTHWTTKLTAIATI